MTPDGLPQPFPASVLAQYPWLDDLITQQIKQRLRSMPSGAEAPTGCLLADLGECLLQMHSAMSDLMHDIIWNRNVELYLEDQIKRAKQARGQDHSDTEFIDYLTQKEQSLKLLQSDIAQSSEIFKEKWESMKDNWTYNPVPISYGLQSPPVSDISYGTFEGRDGSTSESQAPYPAVHIVHQDVAPDVQRIHSMGDPEFRSSLNSRGKGAYQCPYGSSCTKGGVGPSGKLVVFRRNCDFRAHLQKHEKGFKCTLPGCPNKKGFARIDQLKRHQDKVRHVA